jgi:N-methylhydantoinase B
MGLLGGQAGLGTGVEVQGGRVTPNHESSLLVELRGGGDRIVTWAAGGSGFGDPATRPAGLIERDLRDGYITLQGQSAYRAAHAPQPRS